MTAAAGKANDPYGDGIPFGLSASPPQDLEALAGAAVAYLEGRYTPAPSDVIARFLGINERDCIEALKHARDAQRVVRLRHRASGLVGYASPDLPGRQSAPTGASRYQEYLSSPVWARTRELALEYYGKTCCLCNGTDTLNVHHRIYENLGQERLADLIVLCRGCHASYHGHVA